MTWINFAALTQATGQALDDNFTAVFAAGGNFLCTVSGTNALSLTVSGDSPNLAALTNGMTFYGIAVNTNSSSTTAAVGAFAPLAVYKDTPSGPAILAGGEIVQDCAFWLTYDSNLGGGSGGFHLVTGAAILAGQTIVVAGLILGTGATLKRLVTAQVSIAFSVVAANATQDQTATLAGINAGDNVLVAPPASIAAGIMYSAYVPANGSVTIRAANVTVATVTPTGGTFRVTGMGFV